MERKRKKPFYLFAVGIRFRSNIGDIMANRCFMFLKLFFQRNVNFHENQYYFWIIERKGSNGFRRIFTEAFVGYFRLG